MAEPSVFAKYNLETDRPTLPECETRCSTSNGNVAPINNVGKRRRSMLKKTTDKSPAPAEIEEVRWKIWRENRPKTAIPSSPIPKKMMDCFGNREESQPPNRPPSPRPNMKALTTAATDSAFTP